MRHLVSSLRGTCLCSCRITSPSRQLHTTKFRYQGSQPRDQNEKLSRTRNIGIIAHIDAGKTTTTERMLYYSGFTRRLGNVDEGSTVTDFLPTERARGITIQSAAITLHWPPLRPISVNKSASAQAASNLDAGSGTAVNTDNTYTINLIDTPGHADFTFEVIRSLRILDGAICILDGVAGVEAQTEKVWHQASNYNIPRLVYVNKLDRDGASFNKTIHDIASKLNSWPVLCQIPWWKGKAGKFIGVGDVINLRALSWENMNDGSAFEAVLAKDLNDSDPHFWAELQKARVALIEALTSYDDILVEQFLDAGEDYQSFPPEKLTRSIRRILLEQKQCITPVFAGSSLQNIGVQPLLDAVNAFLPCPYEAPDPEISFAGEAVKDNDNAATTVQQLLAEPGTPDKNVAKASKQSTIQNLTALALAFKVVHDPRRGMLVYVRVYAGSLHKSALLYNTNLSVSERAPRLLHMYASEAVEVDEISAGSIGVIPGLKHARTGDTLLVYTGLSSKVGAAPPAPLDTLHLRPIHVPPPLFYISVEPHSLSEEKQLNNALQILLREDPSLTVSTDEESGQTHLAGMGDLHLDIARSRLIDDFKVNARVGPIEIGYRECVQAESGSVTASHTSDLSGKSSEASCSASVAPLHSISQDRTTEQRNDQTIIDLPDSNRLMIMHPSINTNESATLPPNLTFATLISSIRTGVLAALSRGPRHGFQIHSTHVSITFDPSAHITTSTTPAALTSATRKAVNAALKASARLKPTALMEPYMLAQIAVDDASLGAVVQDISSARGGSVLSLDSSTTAADSAGQLRDSNANARRFTSAQLSRVYAPPDPFSTGSGGANREASSLNQRQILARVPLKEMVGYLTKLRSLTGGKGTFIMSVDQYEKMSTARADKALRDMGHV